MKASLRKGFGFGLTSGIITTLGLIVGLHYSTKSRIAVLGGILVIAVADALSDSMGMHISEESTFNHKHKAIWESMASTFISKFAFALSFVVPVLLFQLSTAILISVVWGLLLITVFSYYLARKEKLKPEKVITSHLTITVLVLIVTYLIGSWVSTLG